MNKTYKEQYPDFSGADGKFLQSNFDISKVTEADKAKILMRRSQKSYIPFRYEHLRALSDFSNEISGLLFKTITAYCNAYIDIEEKTELISEQLEKEIPDIKTRVVAEERITKWLRENNEMLHSYISVCISKGFKEGERTATPPGETVTPHKEQVKEVATDEQVEAVLAGRSWYNKK